MIIIPKLGTVVRVNLRDTIEDRGTGFLKYERSSMEGIFLGKYEYFYSIQIGDTINVIPIVRIESVEAIVE